MMTDPVSLEFAAAAAPITTDCDGDPFAVAKLPIITDCVAPAPPPA